ncbi:probable pectate lyase 5 [Dendrobium catenatum]|uniref:Pectate lyase n=1 Tax=Dendrobium catenatum TaxID=906689 RepID=A0A2I0VWZ8_9ASPA|nr:probable pectate lyase 5 [Dendrobium catenatum]PKU67934.1 putative pectate lyase 13 [Dendrobium catenatum]
MLLPILFFLLLLPPPSHPLLPPNSSHPDPDSVALDLLHQIALSRRLALADPSQCLTGNPIDDCLLCSATDWRTDRFHLADCSIGFGRSALGGKNGLIYTVTDPSDSDPANPLPGTLRHAAIQSSPLWIIFAASMSIHLNEELLVNSFKTIDGRGANVHIAGGACITLQYVSNVIIHNLHIHDCVPAGNAIVRSSPTHAGFRGRSDGDGISIFGGRDIWIDHCALSNCADGLIDAIMGSTAITISNSYFSRHNEVMLMGHRDDYLPDSGMQITIAFNRFGEKLVQRMPRCRHGYFHIVNNDYTEWEMYAIGGSANPTINSQGNRYIAPPDPNAKEVTKRIETDEEEWNGWNWRTEGDILVNGAFFVPSGEGLAALYDKASSVEPKSAEFIDELTRNAGVLGGPRDNGGQSSGAYPGANDGGFAAGGGGMAIDGGGGGGGSGASGFFGMVFGGGARPLPSGFQLLLPLFVIFFFSSMYLYPL